MMAAGVVLAAASLVTFFLLVLILICTLVGSLEVPVLGMLPSASAAVFAIQVVAMVGSFNNVPLPLQELATPMLLAIPPLSPDSVLWSSFLLLTAVWLSRRARSLHQGPGHGLSPGAWELRALGFVAFPLTVSSTQLLLRLDEADSPLAGFLLSIVLLCFLLNQAASTWGFVRDVLRDGRVVRTALPQVCVGDPSVSYVSSVFVDKICDELSSMPMNSSQGRISSGTISQWMKTPSWCFSHPLAVVEALDFPEEMISGSKDSPRKHGNVQREELADHSEDELADLLRDQENDEAEQSSSASNLAELGDVFHGGPSQVKICHPISVRSKSCYDVSKETVAGITCLPWLDCAIPSKTLQAIEEVCGSVTLRVHPSQLNGKLSSGQYAVCFDWGTKLPWSWPLHFCMQICLGLWLPIRSSQILPTAAAFCLDLFMLFVAVLLGLFFLKVQAWDHWIDNTALRAAYLEVLLVVSFHVTWDPSRPGVFGAMAATVSVLALLPVLIALLAGVCLVRVALVRMASPLHQDRHLRTAVGGWATDADTAYGSFSFCHPLVRGVSASQDVEVVLQGVDKAILPGRSRVKILLVQLVPLDGRPPEVKQPIEALAHLPLPPWFLFPDAPSTNRGPEAMVPGLVPLAALLAPGRPGKLIYVEECHNGAPWQEALSSFFRSDEGLLRDAALQQVDLARSHEELCITVVEVLPLLVPVKHLKDELG